MGKTRDRDNKDECDARLVWQVRAGDREAFGYIVRRYYSSLLGVARAYGFNADDAADAVQNALILAYVHLGQLQNPALLAPWLRRVTVNACREEGRRRKMTVRWDAVHEATPDQTAMTDTRLVLERVLACLTPETRLTVTLYYEQDCSLQEIAAIQEVPVTTIKSRLRNARARLRKEWETMSKETFTPLARTGKTMQAAIPTFELLRRLDSAGEVHHITFSPDGRRVVTAATLEVSETRFESSIACWEANTGNPVWAMRHTSWAFRPTFLPDGQRIVTVAGWAGHRSGKSGQLLVLDAASGTIIQTIPNTPVAKSIAVTSDGRSVALGGQEEYETYRDSGHQGVAVIYDLVTGELVRKIAPHLNFVTALAFSPDGATLATDALLHDADPEAPHIWRGGDIRLWDVATGTLRHKLPRPNGRGHRHNIAFSPDGALLAAPNGPEGEVLLWDPATGELRRTLDGSGTPVFALAFSPDGTLFACTDSDTAVRLVDCQTWQEKLIPTQSAYSIYALAFSPDGKTLATADKEGTVRFWAALLLNP